MLSARKDVDHGDGAKTCDMSTEWPDDQANLDEFRWYRRNNNGCCEA